MNSEQNSPDNSAKIPVEAGSTSPFSDPKRRAELHASIRKSIEEAMADRPDELVLACGNSGQMNASAKLSPPSKPVVEVSAQVNGALQFVEKMLEALEYRLAQLWVTGQVDQLAHILDGVSEAPLPMESKGSIFLICRLATELNMPEELIKKMEEAQTIEELIKIVAQEPLATGFWQVVEMRLGYVIAGRIGNVRSVAVQLFDSEGKGLGALVSPDGVKSL